MFREKSWFAAAIFICFVKAAALACQEPVYPEHFPAGEVKPYDAIAVVKVTKVVPLADRGRYAPRFKFSGKVLRGLKGVLLPGDAISGETTDEDPRARCAIDLAENKVYLLFLVGKGFPYRLPRFGTLYLEKNQGLFTTYVAEIAVAARH